MIQIITGKLGAGKTLYSVGKIADLLASGSTVVTNISINWSEMCAYCRSVHRVNLNSGQLIILDPEIHRDWENVVPWGELPESGVTNPCFVEVFLDEIHLFFNARDWQKTSMDSKGLLSFLTQSRKASINVSFIAQDSETVEKQFRVLAEWELHVQSSDHLPTGILGTLPVKFFMVLKKSMRTGLLITRFYKTYNRRLFTTYRSTELLDSAMRNLSEKAVRVARYKLQSVPFHSYIYENICIFISPFFKFLGFKS